MLNLTLTETQGIILHRALGEEIERITEDLLPRALKATDQVADQRVEMLVDRALQAAEVRDEIGEALGLDS